MQPVRKAIPVLKARKVRLDHKAIAVLRELLDHKVRLAHKVPLAQRETLALKARLDCRELQALKVRKAPRV